MTPVTSHRTLLAAALFVTACVCGACKRSNHSAPNIDGLKDALQKSAETSLPAPSITNGKITLRVAADRVEAEEERLVRLATAAGGTALRSDGGEAASNLLVRIPRDKADDFREKATGRPAPPADSATEENQLIEIVINPAK